MSHSYEANSRQVGGDHYSKRAGLQHWDIVRVMEWDYFQGNITKYLDRHRRKNGLQDLLKARHYLDKYMEIEYPEEYADYLSEQQRPDDSELEALQKMAASISQARDIERAAEEESMREYAASLNADKGEAGSGGTLESTRCSECGCFNESHTDDCPVVEDWNAQRFGRRL